MRQPIVSGKSRCDTQHQDNGNRPYSQHADKHRLDAVEQTAQTAAVGNFNNAFFFHKNLCRYRKLDRNAVYLIKMINANNSSLLFFSQ